MREAAKSLGISRTSLEKWIRRINETEEKKPPEQRKRIEPQRHEWDWRFYTITDEDVERIRQTRSQMPERVARPRTSVIPSYSSLAFDRRSIANDDVLVPYEPIVPRLPTPRPRPPRIAVPKVKSEGEGLPDGMMAVEKAARDHGLSPSTVRNWAKAGELETFVEDFGRVNGQFGPNQPLTPRGIRQMCERAQADPRHRVKFRACALCPHDGKPESATPTESE
jgi:transposase-like protein